MEKKEKIDPFAAAAGPKISKRKEVGEMAIVGLNENPEIEKEIGLETIDSMFVSSKKVEKFDNYEFIALTGKSFTGKTRLALSCSKMTKELYKNELEPNEVKEMDRIFDKIPDASKVYVIGLEESTGDELFSSKNSDYYSNVDIKFKEITEYNGNGAIYDYIETYNNFLKYLKYIQSSGLKDITLVIDSMSPILQAMHYILRTKIMKIDPMNKEQGVPQRYWFWRNQQMESIMLLLKSLKMHKILTFKTAKSDSEDFVVRWHEETNYHLSKTRIDMSILTQNNKSIFISTFDKCRNNPSLYGKTFHNLNGCRMFLNIYGGN